MSTNRGIFEALPTSEQNGGPNPFSFAGEGVVVTNPFAGTAEGHSPFASVVDSGVERSVPEPGKPAKIPAPRQRPPESPFQMTAENGSAYGYEAPQVTNIQAAPFSSAPVQPQYTAAAVPQAQHTPFSVHREPAAVAPVAAPSPGQLAWPQNQDAAGAASFAHHLTSPAPQPAAHQPAAPQPAASQPAAAQPAPSYHAPVEHPFAAAMNPPPSLPPQEPTPVFKQLELRAIFGVDREMNGDEILQRTRSLPGIKLVARINISEVMALESLKHTLSGLGFGGGNIRLYSGSVPIEFIRDGNTVLAVQTDGGFAPGVREAIMIVARELEKMG